MSINVNSIWHYGYDKCIGCGETKYVYHSKGMCYRCASKKYYHENKGRRIEISTRHNKKVALKRKEESTRVKKEYTIEQLESMVKRRQDAGKPCLSIRINGELKAMPFEEMGKPKYCSPKFELWEEKDAQFKILKDHYEKTI